MSVEDYFDIYGEPDDEDYYQEDEYMTFEGFIKKLHTKTGSGRKGPWTLYSAKIEKADGSEYDEWVSFGFSKPDVAEGGYYIIEASKDAKGYFKADSYKAAEPPKRVAGGGGNEGGGNSKQDSIHYQNARGNALTFVQIAVQLDALPFIKTAGKAGEAKRFAELQALVDKLTVQYFNDTDTLRLLDSVEDAGAVENAEGEDEDDATPGDDE